MRDMVSQPRTEVAVNRPTIGQLLVATGKIRAEDVPRIVRAQAKHGLRFGSAAVKLGLASEDDMQHALAQQFDYPRLRADSITVDEAVISAVRPHDPQVEVLRTLRNQLALHWRSDYSQLAVTSPAAGQGASDIAANLAVVFSQVGARTLLIDADMRNPRQHSLFRLDRGLGLSDILAGHAGMEVIQSIYQLKNMFVLPAGTEPPNPLELLARPALRRLLDIAREQFDVLIIDTPPALQCADAQALCAHIGSTLIVARRHHARTADLERLKQQLNAAGAIAVGAVLMDF